MLRKQIIMVLVGLSLAACVPPMVEVVDTNEIEQATLNRAAGIAVYQAGQTVPRGLTVISPISAYSCKHVLWDEPASRGDALLQLQVKALELGATAITNLTFDARGTDTLGTNCWESVNASGIAMR